MHPSPRSFGSSIYEETGAIRDVIQNHKLQVIACLAMEAPAGGDPEADRIVS